MLDIAIIGGGVAGLTAGLYAARGGAKVTLFESFIPGGQTGTILNLENFPGFPDGVAGVELMIALQKQATQFGLEFCYESVKDIDLSAETKRIITSEQEYPTKAIIIATGASPRKIGLPREAELTGHGISYCATCDGALYRDKNVAVIGGGDTALTDAIVLSRYATKVYLIHRRDKFRGSDILQKRITEIPAIETVMNHVPVEIIGEKKLQGIKLRSVITNFERTIPIDGLFVAVGISPQSEFLEGRIDLSPSGEIITDESMQTNLPGVYAAGDCRNTPLRQVITAAADGAIAANSAINYINS